MCDHRFPSLHSSKMRLQPLKVLPLTASAYSACAVGCWGCTQFVSWYGWAQQNKLFCGFHLLYKDQMNILCDYWHCASDLKVECRNAEGDYVCHSQRQIFNADGLNKPKYFTRGFTKSNLFRIMNTVITNRTEADHSLYMGTNLFLASWWAPRVQFFFLQ